jgi:FkbM family methyltransferase
MKSQVVAEELRSVATMRIDTLSKTLAPLTVVKIDVEGAEAEALETISNYRDDVS